MSENTRPQPSAEPVAWMYIYTMQYQPKLECTKRLSPVICLSLTRWENVREPWTETPLYPASALEAARREALEEAANFVEIRKCSIHFSAAERHAAYEHAVRLAEHLRALKDTSNAG